MTAEQFDFAIDEYADRMARDADAIIERYNIPPSEAWGILATCCERVQHQLAAMEGSDDG